MKGVKIIIASVLMTFLGASVSFSQQDPHFTQYFDNMLFINPAYAGSNGVLNITGMHREQWVGFDGRPRSSTLSIHSPMPYEPLGVGLTAVNDRIGDLNQTMVYADVAYSLRFKNHNGRLAFGLKGGVNIITLGSKPEQADDPNDPKVLQDIRNKVNPNFGFGVYYHTPSFFIGFSSPKLLNHSYDGSDKESLSGTNMEKRHFFGTLGGVINVADKWKLRPSGLVKFTGGSPMSLDLTLAAIYNDKFYFGANYRLLSSMSAFVQFHVTPQLRIGLASDFGLQEIRAHNHGTFEVMLSYDFSFLKGGVYSPRYF